jgi:P-type Ca2+ transporter type 2A
VTINSFHLLENNEFNVTGTSYSPFDGKVEKMVKSDSLSLFSAICSHCNNSTLTVSPGGKYGKVGESTEAALKVLVEKIGESYAESFERIATLEFDRDRKSMSVIVKEKRTGKLFLFVKGAPETIFMRSKVVDPSYHDKVKEYGRDALRVLCIAYKELEANFDFNLLLDPSKYAQIESKLNPLGLVAMRDPPRPEIRDSIEKCRAAGIRVLVLTGDNQMTAEAICDQIGLFENVQKVDKSVSMTGAEFDELSDPSKSLDSLRLLSRVEPRHKSLLVSLLQESGHVVAMTGDGVNDAPALKRADIGIAMGSGTDVARAASDIILTDDNFSTIVSAVQEGRSIYDNTKQFIRYLISSNIGEVACVLGTALVGLPEVLSPVQLLWVNLVTDGLPATALGFNPPSPGSMNQKPRGKNDPLVDGWLFIRYLIIGTYVGLATIGGFVWYLTTASRGPHLTWETLNYLGPESSIIASTVALSVLVVIEMANALNSLSENESLLCLGPQNNPILLAAIALSLFLHYLIISVPELAKIFGVAPLNKEEWFAVIGISVPVILIDEVLKFITRNSSSRSSEKKKQD